MHANQTGLSRKNVVHVSGFYEDRTENISTRRRREAKHSSTQVKTPEAAKQPEKDTSDMEADITEFPNTESYDVTSHFGKSNSPLQERENMGEYFSQKIREIDKDLGGYVSPFKSTQVEENFLSKETSPLFDLEKLRNGLEENQCPHQPQNLIHTTHMSCGTPLQEVTNTPLRSGLTDATL